MSENTAVKYKKTDFESDQEVRWCPGCGDYSILATLQRFLATKDTPLQDYLFISGIGCSSRFPYYMSTYGFHTIHGRAPAVATGARVVNPELSIWLVTGDGDGLSIGGNHLLHLLRRNPNIKVLFFNNQIYGLTKGQYSPTSELGKVTKSTPFGSADEPLNAAEFALGAKATFVARTIDVDAKHMLEVFERADKHKGTAFIEIYQNCNIFNDGAFDKIRERETREENVLAVKDDMPLIFGKDKNKGIKITNEGLQIVNFDSTDKDGAIKAGVSIYNSKNRNLAFALSGLSIGGVLGENPAPVATGVLFQSSRITFEETLKNQAENAQKKRKSPHSTPDETLKDLFHSGGETWIVS